MPFKRIKYWLVFFSFLPVLNFIKAQTPAFINISEQLVNNEVTSIIQDKKGFMWFGTRGGLQRFDGYEMKLLKNDYNFSSNLLSQSIETLHNDKKGNIWIGTKSGGLSEYKTVSGDIINYTNPNQNIKGFNADYILSILDTDAEKLLIGTWQGFQFLNKETGKFTVVNNKWRTFDLQQDGKNGYWLATNSGLKHLTSQLVNDTSLNFGIPGINITCIVTDYTDHSLWLGTWDQGLIHYTPANKQVKIYRHIPGDASSISSNNTYRVVLDSKGGLWIGTWGGGLNRYNRKSQSFQKINLDIPGLYTNDNQIILTIMEDPSGLLWVGTDGTGVFKYDLNQKKFINIGYNAQTGSLQGSTHILGVYIDPFDKLWVGRKGGGIQYAPGWAKASFQQFKDFTVSASSKLVYEGRSFLQTDNYLWVGTSNGLVRILNNGQSPRRAEVFLPEPGNRVSISGKKVNAIAKDSSGKIWIGLQETGLSCIETLDKNNKPVFKNYLHSYGDKDSLQNERVSCLLVDRHNQLWIGTYKGLHLYDRQKDKFLAFFHSEDATTSISNNTVLCLAEDTYGNIWAGTQFGLNRITIDKKGGLSVKRYTTTEGLPNDYIHAVLPDKKGNIWVSTNKGIVRLNTLINSIAVFDKRDGVVSKVFSENAFFSDKSGRLFFGGLEGVTLFHPDSIVINTFAPPIYFTNLSVNNQPVEFGMIRGVSSILKKPFSETNSLVLSYKQNNFAVEFAALDYHAPDKNDYMYKLEGFNTDWIKSGTSRMVSFTNLKAGNYYLKVKATNSDKIWGDHVYELKITVLPPPWKTWWAYLIYISVFLFLLWLTRYLGLREVTLKNQLTLARIDREQEKKLGDFKERLFTNISHEFRTPLTLILGPLEDLLQRSALDFKIEKSLRLIQKQSKRMLRMVNQLLDFQKAESGSLKLNIQPGELVSFCFDIFTLFKDEAQRREINYSYEKKYKFLPCNFDHNKLEIIVFNLLSNAFKFTNNKGHIILRIDKTNNNLLEIGVEDDGKGIPADEIDRIFDRFYRGKEMDATTISGTGIGLSFVKELVELHGGTIEAFSNGIKGSIFRVTLPVDRPANEVDINVNPARDVKNETFNNDAIMKEDQEYLAADQELPIILVVEDEVDILQYIYEILSPSFKVITAANGREGHQKALESIPDLVISDIMMPEMDGIELCRKLKSDQGTSHIPIILLTALSDMAHHVQGIQEGADVYLPKPFNSQLLLVHVHNLITTRNKLKELYAKRVVLGVGNFEIKTYEEEFLFKLMKLVEENISNSNFSNDELANLMYMSRSTFYRKLKAVTGMSGNEFIRTARLNFAAKLLESGNHSVTEAALESGFNDIKYFRKRFQDQFGVSPSEYKK